MIEALEPIDSLFSFLLSIAVPRLMVYCWKIPSNRKISPSVTFGDINIYLLENFTETAGQTTGNYSSSQAATNPTGMCWACWLI